MSDPLFTGSKSTWDTFIVHIDSDLESLLPKFMTNRKKEVTAMREALVQQDFETVGKIAHDIKGASGIYGFDHLAGLGATIERAAKTRSVVSIETDLALIETYLEHIQVVFD